MICIWPWVLSYHAKSMTVLKNILFWRFYQVKPLFLRISIALSLRRYPYLCVMGNLKDAGPLKLTISASPSTSNLVRRALTPKNSGRELSSMTQRLMFRYSRKFRAVDCVSNRRCAGWLSEPLKSSLDRPKRPSSSIEGIGWAALVEAEQFAAQSVCKFVSWLFWISRKRTSTWMPLLSETCSS